MRAWILRVMLPIKQTVKNDRRKPENVKNRWKSNKWIKNLRIKQESWNGNQELHDTIYICMLAQWCLILTPITREKRLVQAQNPAKNDVVRDDQTKRNFIRFLRIWVSFFTWHVDRLYSEKRECRALNGKGCSVMTVCSGVFKKLWMRVDQKHKLCRFEYGHGQLKLRTIEIDVIDCFVRMRSATKCSSSKMTWFHRLNEDGNSIFYQSVCSKDSDKAVNLIDRCLQQTLSHFARFRWFSIWGMLIFIITIIISSSTTSTTN